MKFILVFRFAMLPSVFPIPKQSGSAFLTSPWPLFCASSLKSEVFQLLKPILRYPIKSNVVYLLLVLFRVFQFCHSRVVLWNVLSFFFQNKNKKAKVVGFIRNGRINSFTFTKKENIKSKSRSPSFPLLAFIKKSAPKATPNRCLNARLILHKSKSY